MKMVPALVAVLALAVLGWLGATLPWVFAVMLPAAALAVFVVGVVVRVWRWGRSPVPFRITSVAGQQASLPWLPRSPLDSPRDRREAALRVALDVLFFRTLFRNTRVRRGAGRQPFHQSDRWLWGAALAFHWSLLAIVVRHLRFFFQYPPAVLAGIERWDGFFQLTTPTLFMSDVLLLAGLGFLLARRLFDRSLRYVSLATDYFPLLLILAVAVSGIYMRYFGKVDLLAVKELSLGLVTLQPRAPAGLSAAFVIHLVLVSTLLAYFPFSKLVHMAGIFLSPTRNLPNDNRRRRHVNPWNPPLHGHTYEEWEAEFHDKLVAAGIPLDAREAERV
jgi:nitrate reductase gamma subunit